MAGYLFVHFTGEEKDGEQVYFSLSRDGLYWKDLNNGKPVLVSGIGEMGVRDPFLVRDSKKGKYYLISTDLRIEAGKGWQAAQMEGSRSLIVWESEDLIHWSKERACMVGVPGAGCVWAPEAVYDEDKDAFLVFWASMIRLNDETESKQRIYASYTEDFRSFSEPFIFLEKENHVIDTTIIKSNSLFYRFSKDETTKRIILESSDELTGNYREISSPCLAEIKGIEGPECYLLPDGKTWCLIVDRFMEGKGYLPLISTDLENGDFQVLNDSQFDFGKSKKRHGGVIKIEDEEYKRLWEAFGDENPVLDGLYADPDLVNFGGTSYLYPTTDGYKDWAGTEFSVFSSEDGYHFKKEGLILDLAEGDVPWAVGNAWAPCAAEKNGRYYFYFCGRRGDGSMCIGAASAPTPTGPFEAMEKPLLTPEMMKTHGLKLDQVIDPSIYQEGENDYLLFGNGCPVIVKLSEDMVSIEADSFVALEGAYDFREAITVLKRNGIYHFTWSCDDTRSENYHVNYGTSNSLFGPIHYEYPILEKAGGSLGTGHHSIVKIPGEDQYLIAYHRFGTPVKKYLDGKGFNREVCVGKLEFGDDGKMMKFT